MGFLRKNNGGNSGNGVSQSAFPILDWENGKVIDKSYNYGDIRRYGAKCDDVTDDSAVLQWALDNCCFNDIPVYIPPGVKVLIEKEIVLKETYNKDWRYMIKGEGGSTNIGYIHQMSQYLFVGEKFYEEKPCFTKVSIDLKGVNIRCSQTLNCVCFKALVLNASDIQGNKFYFPYVLIEGGIAVGTKFTRNRIQSFLYSVLSSISIIDKNHDYEYVKSLCNGSDYSVFDGILVENEGSTVTDYSKYSAKCNDGYFDYNYIAGSTSRTKYPNCVFAVEAIDADFIVNYNWFEFCKYVVSRTIGLNTQSVVGNTYKDNVFQFFHRFFDPRYRYSYFILVGNQFYSFQKKGLKSRFTKAIDDDVENSKSGVIVGDFEDAYKPYLTNIKLLESYFTNCDYSIYFINNTNGSSFRFSCIEKNSTFYNQTNKPKIRLNKIEDVFNASYFECFDNMRDFTSETEIIEGTTYVNTFLGQTVYIGDNIYKSVWYNGEPKLVLIGNISQ